MKINQLIQELEFMRDRYGDVEVKVCESNGVSYSVGMVYINAYQNAVILS